MRSSVTAAVALVAALASGVGSASAQTLNACTAAQIISQEGASCPNNNTQCTIKKKYNVGNGCVLDFGTTRVVVIDDSGELDIHSGAATIKAGTFTVSPGGLVEGQGTATTPPGDRGGMLTIQTTGPVNVQIGPTFRGEINLQGYATGGTLLIQAGGTVTIQGNVQVDGTGTFGAGGDISVRAGGDILGQSSSLITATGTNDGPGGFMDYQATGRVEFVEELEAHGSDGGLVDIFAGADTVVRNVDVQAVGDAGSGGCVGIVGGTTTQLLGFINLNGNISSIASGGGDGGVLDVEANFGNLSVADRLLAEGNSPDGGGGQISLIARGSISVATGATASAQGVGPQGCGGELLLEADLDVTSNGELDVSGGLGGNSIDVLAGRNVTLTGRLNLEGENLGAFGGAATLEAGIGSGPGQPQHSGSITINNVVNANGGGCSLDFGCGLGGSVDVTGCDVTIASTSGVTVLGKTGGQILLVAREQLRVQALLDATAREAGTNGTIVLRHKASKPPIVTVTPTPAPITQPRPTCTAPGTPATCLDPCPICGNGGPPEYPETCDTSGTPQSCDGCSLLCQVESCNDSSPCTTDSCTPSLGCRNAPVAEGTACDDATVCNGRETCSGGGCFSGPAPNCNDNNACTTDPCNPSTGCVVPHPPAPSGTPCSDNNACTLGDACNASATCVPGAPRICNDTRECTTDTCNPATGCVFTNRTGPCTDDGLPCTLDVCAAGNCTHPGGPNGTSCEDGQFCTVNDTCQGGLCTAGPARVCDDGNACTDDSCDEAGNQCVTAPGSGCCGNGVTEAPEQCDDGNTSNTDACLNSCLLPTCGDGFVRTGVEECDAGAGNSNAPNAACRLDCRPRRCGDGVTDNLSGEQCDDGGVASGDGCSATCGQEPPATAELIPGKGSTKIDCALEWAMNQPALDRNGIPSFKQSCQDGVAGCDFDGTAGVCVFHVWLCANNNDTRLPLCTPGPAGVGTVGPIEIKRPSTRQAASRPEDAANRQQLAAAAAAAENVGLNVCGPRMDIRVPLKPSGKKGVKSLKLRGLTSLGLKDTDSLKLYCLP